MMQAPEDPRKCAVLLEAADFEATLEAYVPDGKWRDIDLTEIRLKKEPSQFDHLLSLFIEGRKDDLRRHAETEGDADPGLSSVTADYAQEYIRDHLYPTAARAFLRLIKYDGRISGSMEALASGFASPGVIGVRLMHIGVLQDIVARLKAKDSAAMRIPRHQNTDKVGRPGASPAAQSGTVANVGALAGPGPPGMAAAGVVDQQGSAPSAAQSAPLLVLTETQLARILSLANTNRPSPATAPKQTALERHLKLYENMIDQKIFFDLRQLCPRRLEELREQARARPKRTAVLRGDGLTIEDEDEDTALVFDLFDFRNGTDKFLEMLKARGDPRSADRVDFFRRVWSWPQRSTDEMVRFVEYLFMRHPEQEAWMPLLESPGCADCLAFLHSSRKDTQVQDRHPHREQGKRRPSRDSYTAPHSKRAATNRFKGKPLEQRPFCRSVIDTVGRCRYGDQCVMDCRCVMPQCKKARHSASDCPHFVLATAQAENAKRRGSLGLQAQRPRGR